MFRHNQIASFLRKIRVLKITKHLRYEFNKKPLFPAKVPNKFIKYLSTM